MGRASKAKGSSFERLVAKLVLEAFPDMTAKDCYRTPLSGGHPTADAGDLVLSERLRKLFPYSVECKHTKEWSLHHVMPLRSNVSAWIAQTVKAAEKNKLRPMLVMRGNNTAIYAMVELQYWPAAEMDLDGDYNLCWRKEEPHSPVLVAAFDRRVWVVVLFSDFLRRAI